MTFLLLLARVSIGPPGFGLVLLPILVFCWLASKAGTWVNSPNRLQQVAGRVLLTGLGLVVLYGMFAFVQALIG